MIKKPIFALFPLILVGALFLFQKFIEYDTPQFFPINNSEGTYMVTKGCPASQGWDESLDLLSDVGYCIEYEGPGVFMGEDKKTNFVRITVGNTDLDLEKYLGKKVKVVSGRFISSSKQCIQDKCIPIGGPLAVLNISKIEVVAY